MYFSKISLDNSYSVQQNLKIYLKKCVAVQMCVIGKQYFPRYSVECG